MPSACPDMAGRRRNEAPKLAAPATNHLSDQLLPASVVVVEHLKPSLLETIYTFHTSIEADEHWNSLHHGGRQ